MSEDKGLLERIGQLAGQLSYLIVSWTTLMTKGHINLHKTQIPLSGRHEHEYIKPPQSAISQRTTTAARSTSWKSSRSAPYPRPHLTSGKSAINPHRNRTLVLNKSKNYSQACNDLGKASVGSIASTCKSQDDDDKWVMRNDRHMQLIASSVFDKETQLRKQAMDETRPQKVLQKDQWEKSTLGKHLLALDATSGAAKTSTAPSNDVTSNFHRININGLSFQVVNGGSKLSRIRS